MAKAPASPPAAPPAPLPPAPWEPDKLGRPAIYTPELASTVLALLSAGLSLIAIAKREGMPSRTTVYEWIEKVPGFADGYSRARALQADSLAEEIVEIADTELDPQRARNRMNARQWYAGKVKPKVYGDQIDVNASVRVAMPTAEELQAAARKLLEEL